MQCCCERFDQYCHVKFVDGVAGVDIFWNKLFATLAAFILLELCILCILIFIADYAFWFVALPKLEKKTICLSSCYLIPKTH